jgi:predicted metal-dependent peptidase
LICSGSKGFYAINDILKESGFVLPAGVLGGMGTDQSAEAIYKRLPEVKVKSNNPDEFGEVRDYPGKDGKKATPAETARALQEVKVMVAQAYAQAKAMGNMPGGLERVVQTITHPRVDWREVLRFMASYM